MDTLYTILKLAHIIGFVFMSIPLFNLIVVNERALMGGPFNYATDRYMENIIKHGASRCYVFQLTVLVSGILMLVFGPAGYEALWTNGILLIKTIILLVLMVLLSVVHFKLQPEIEAYLKDLDETSDIPEDLAAKLKPHQVMRKTLATFCLFLVLTTIILGMQVYNTFDPLLNVVLIAAAALFSWRVNKTLILFGWM